jgi:hypothetical protein
VRTQAADLDRQLLSVVRESAVCRRLMTIPGVGAWIAAALPVRRDRLRRAYLAPRRCLAARPALRGRDDNAHAGAG